MTIPFGRRRLVFTLAVVPSPPVPRRQLDVPAAFDASDAELARLAAPHEEAVDRLRWDAMATLYGGVRSV